MKTKYIAVTVVGLLFGGLTWFCGAPAPADTLLDRQTLAVDGITLDVPNHAPQIVQSDAIANAKAAYENVLVGNWDVQAEYHLVSASMTASLHNSPRFVRTPCYVVSFTHSGPPTYNSPRVLHVLVDAENGAVLQCFFHK